MYSWWTKLITLIDELINRISSITKGTYVSSYLKNLYKDELTETGCDWSDDLVSMFVECRFSTGLWAAYPQYIVVALIVGWFSWKVTCLPTRYFKESISCSAASAKTATIAVLRRWELVKWLSNLVEGRRYNHKYHWHGHMQINMQIRSSTLLFYRTFFMHHFMVSCTSQPLQLMTMEISCLVKSHTGRKDP